MCGRFTLTDPDPRMLRQRFRLNEQVDPGHEPRYNIAPTDPVLAVRERSDGERTLGRLRWGLVPHWAEDEKTQPLMINARAEGIDERPAYRDAFQRHRCLIPADGFYEWRETDSGKQPVWVSAAEGGLFAFAGLWAARKRDDDDDVLYSCTIVTCEPNELLSPIHDRMPVILRPDDEDEWISRDADPGDVKRLLRPIDSDALGVREVSESVNDVRDDGPHLLEPPMKLF